MKSMIGVMVRYCGHGGSFIADVTVVGTAAVVRANGPVVLKDLDRLTMPQYWLRDYPSAGFWRPDMGVFVVPQNQLRVWRHKKNAVDPRKYHKASLATASAKR